MKPFCQTGSRLAGKVAWISGASSGIGEATAELFVREGAEVVLVGRRATQGEAVVRKISECDGKALWVTADVADENQVNKSIEACIRRFGRLDILVNNAGMVEVRTLDQFSSELWDRVMGVNVKSMFLSFKAALPHLAKQSRSWVVNVGSISSHVGQAETPVYTTSKHAVIGLTRSIALDYSHLGLRCNCVCPGITETPMLRRHLDTTPDPEATLSKRLKRVPMGIALSPVDVAKSILYFSCDDSSGITGSNLIVDGGYLSAAEWQSNGTAFQDSPQGS